MRYDNFNYNQATYNTPEYIDDRTQEDVAQRVPKACLNAKDLNRIEHNCQELADMLNHVGYFITIHTKTDWTRLNLTHRYEIDRVRSNVKTIMEAYQAFDRNLSIRFWESLDYLDVNTLEEALKITDEIIKHTAHQWRYAGRVTAGEGVSL